MIVNQKKKESLLQWASIVLSKEITVNSLRDGMHFLELLEKTQEKPLESHLSNLNERLCKVAEDLESFYQVNIDELIGINNILQSQESTEFQTFSILLLILTYGLQSKNAADFKHSACRLPEELQQEIMHLTEELLQTDPSDERPIQSQMMKCLSKERDRTLSLPAQPTKLIFDGKGDCPLTPVTYTNSPTTPLREWLDSPQMIQKSKLRMKEQELRRVKKQLVEEENLRHDSELELKRLKTEIENKDNEIRMLDMKLTRQVECSDEFKNQIADLLANQEKWEEQQKEWTRLLEKIDEYKRKAEEAGWWEKEHESVVRERDTLRVKAAALDELRGRARDRLHIEQQMADLILKLREADEQIRALLEARAKNELESQNLRSRNEELERRLTSFTLNDSSQFGECIFDDSGTATPCSGESMRVVSDLRIAELEAQLAELTQNLEKAVDARQRLELETTQLASTVEAVESKLTVVTDEKETVSGALASATEKCLDLERENQALTGSLKEMEKDNSELKSNLDDLEGRLREGETALKSSAADREELRQHLNAAHEKADGLEERCWQLSATLDGKSAALDRQAAELRLFVMKHEEAVSEIGGLLEKVAALDLQKEALELRCGELEASVNRLSDGAKADLDAISLLDAQLSNAISARNETDAEVTRLHSCLDEADRRHAVEVEDLQRQLQRLSESAEQSEDVASRLETEKDELRSRNEELASKLEDASSEVAAMKSAEVDLKGEIQRLSQAETELLWEKKEQRARIGELEKSLQDASEDIKKLYEEITVYHKENEKLAKEHHSQTKRFQEEVRHLREERTKGEEQMRSLLQTASENATRMEQELTSLHLTKLEADLERFAEEPKLSKCSDGDGEVEKFQSGEDLISRVSLAKDRLGNLQERKPEDTCSVEDYLKQWQEVELVFAAMAEIGHHMREIEQEVKEKGVRVSELESLLHMEITQREESERQCSEETHLKDTTEQRLAEIMQEKEKLVKESAASANSLESLISEINRYQTLVENMNEKMMISEMNLVELKTTVEYLNMECSTKNEEISDNERTIEGLQKELADARTDVSDVESKVMEERTAREESEKCNAALQSAISSLEMERRAYLAEQEKLARELSEAERQSVMTVELQQKNETLASQLDQLQKEAENSRAALKNLPVIESIRDSLKEQLDVAVSQLREAESEKSRLQKEMEYTLAKADNAELCRVEEARSCERLREVIRVQETELDTGKLRLKDSLAEVEELLKNKESSKLEMEQLASSLKKMQTERDRLASEVELLQKDASLAQSLRGEVSRLESEVEQLGRELQAGERQKLEISQAVENIWSQRLQEVEEQNEFLTDNVKHLEEELTKSRRSLRELNTKMEDELRSAALKLETRERAFSEERLSMRRMTEEAREMMEAYREIYDAQLNEEREEQNRKTDWSAEAMAQLTEELENVRRNHTQLIEAQEGELQAVRREVEAYQEETRQAEERVRSLKSELLAKEKAISDVKLEQCDLTEKLKEVTSERDAVIESNVNLESELHKRESAIEEANKRLEEKDNLEKVRIMTIDNLSDKITELESVTHDLTSNNESLLMKMRESELLKSEGEQKLMSLTNALEKSRDEVNSVLERLAAALRDKEEAISGREHAERRNDALMDDCRDWRELNERIKEENQRLKNEIETSERSEENLRTRCSAIDASKNELMVKVCELTERVERQRKRIEEVEKDSSEEERLYRVRLSTAERRQQSLENEVASLESQLTDWRSRCQKLNVTVSELEERNKSVEYARRLYASEADTELLKERESRERYRIRCSELQSDLIRLENQCSEQQSLNRQLQTKVRSLEMQTELSAASGQGNSVLLPSTSCALKRHTSHSSFDFSPVYGSHVTTLNRAQSEGGNLTVFAEKLNFESCTTPAGDRQRRRIQEDAVNQLRRRHSSPSPMTPPSRRQQLRCHEAPEVVSERINEDLRQSETDVASVASSTSKSGAPVTGLAALFSCEDEPNEGMEWKRIHELQKRNTKQPMHMQTSYPVETQLCNPQELASMLMSENSRLSSSTSSSKKVRSDLSNPYDLNRKTASSISEDLMRSGGSARGSILTEADRCDSEGGVSHTDNLITSRSTDCVFKVPSAPSGPHPLRACNKPYEPPSDSAPFVDKENDTPAQNENVRPNDRKSLAFEIQNSPKKQSNKSSFFGQHKKKQKYKVQDAEKESSGEVHNHKSLDRDEKRWPETKSRSKRFSSSQEGGASPPKHRPQEDNRILIPETPLNCQARPTAVLQRPRTPVRGRRELIPLRVPSQSSTESNSQPRSQPGLVDRRRSRSLDASERLTRKLASMARKLTPKRSNRVAAIPRNSREV